MSLSALTFTTPQSVGRQGRESVERNKPTHCCWCRCYLPHAPGGSSLLRGFGHALQMCWMHQALRPNPMESTRALPSGLRGLWVSHSTGGKTWSQSPLPEEAQNSLHGRGGDSPRSAVHRKLQCLLFLENMHTAFIRAGSLYSSVLTHYPVCDIKKTITDGAVSLQTPATCPSLTFGKGGIQRTTKVTDTSPNC